MSRAKLFKYLKYDRLTDKYCNEENSSGNCVGCPVKVECDYNVNHDVPWLIEAYWFLKWLPHSISNAFSNYYVKPSFDNNYISGNVNDEIVLEDLNNVLSGYEVYNDKGVAIYPNIPAQPEEDEDDKAAGFPEGRSGRSAGSGSDSDQ